jgi:hypothetical protein
MQEGQCVRGKIAICTRVSRYQPALVQKRPARFLPGVDAALDVTGRGETRILRGLHRHGRAFAEGAIEDDALAGGAREFIEHAAGPDIGGESGVHTSDGLRLLLPAITKHDPSTVSHASVPSRGL